MFAVDGWKLPKVVPQKIERKRKDAPVETAAKQVKKQKVKPATASTVAKKPGKDKSKYTPYGKDKGNSGSNVIPVAKERKPRPQSPPPTAPLPSPASSGRTSKKESKPERKPLARPPRSEREATPPKHIVADPPPRFSGNSKNLTALQRKMAAKLSGARFRWINERLYTTTGAEALDLISAKPDMFDEYHAGFRNQVQDWPSNPVDSYIARLEAMLPVLTLQKKASPCVVADLGCGEAMIAARIQAIPAAKHTLRIQSFDLKAANERIVACDMANLPLPDASVDIAIFCLSLMGTDFLKFIHEAVRVVRSGGEVWIAEIKSRFSDGDAKNFIEALSKLGLSLKARDDSNKMFISLDFTRDKDKRGKTVAVPESNSKKIGQLLKPCTYKKR